MSGIAGIIHFDGEPATPGLVERMTAAMPYRGPDGIDHWVQGSAALGQCMMRTTPESMEERQPWANEDQSLVLVMDGRVDNWDELRHELLGRGAVLRNRSDAELVLRAYETWGCDCLPHIDGDFAFVIWNVRQRTAFCARDRLGNKPFHYHWDGKTFVFASELHTILALPWVGEQLNEGMVAEFLAYDWQSRDETFWIGVMRLVAAHRMVVDARGPMPALYWEPDLQASVPFTSDEDHIEHYRSLLSDVVRRMSRSTQALACEVSGGLDSSAIYAVAKHLRSEGRLLSSAVDGYTLAFYDDPGVNDIGYARAVGEHWGSMIQEVAPSRMALDWYRDWARQYREFPSYPNGVMGLGIRQEARRRGSRVLLVGVGGDEWLGGSRSYYAEALAAGRWDHFMACLRNDRRDAGLRRSLWWAFRHGCYPLLPEVARVLVRKLVVGWQRDEVDRLAWLMPAMKSNLRERQRRIAQRPTGRLGRIGQRELSLILTGAFSTYARDLEERMATSAGIELRRPFFHPSIIQFTFSTSPSLRLRGHADKFLHRQAMRGLLPDSVLTRANKAEFSSTFREHLPELRGVVGRIDRDVGIAWVDPGRAMRLYCRACTDQNSGQPEWLLWALFGTGLLASTP